jgi:hypothetical protein
LAHLDCFFFQQSTAREAQHILTVELMVMQTKCLVRVSRLSIGFSFMFERERNCLSVFRFTV